MGVWNREFLGVRNALIDGVCPDPAATGRRRPRLSGVKSRRESAWSGVPGNRRIPSKIIFY